MTSEFEEDRQVLEKIRRLIATDNYIFTEHALKRVDERKVSVFDALYVLKTGRHERDKTQLNSKYQVWNYAISGTTVDGIIPNHSKN